MAEQDDRLSPNLLGLPPLVRRRIYGYLHGLVAPDAAEIVQRPGLDYWHDLNRRKQDRKRFWHRCSDFYGLLLSCRGLYREASQILYSTNCFSIRYSTRRSLQTLRNLTPDSLAALSHLRIVLAEASCHPRGKRIETSQTACCSALQRALNEPEHCKRRGHHHDKPLKVWDNRLAREWGTAVADLLAYVTENQLHLAVICDVEPSAEGREFAAYLMSQLTLLPKLKDCSVRLCKDKDAQLQEMARMTVLQARRIAQRGRLTESTTASSTSPGRDLLTALPTEMRHEILGYTDLITPWREVEWITLGGFRASRHWCENRTNSGRTCPARRHDGCQFQDCSETFPERRHGCFCRLHHSAFSSAKSGACRCWQSPLPLFLVCQTLYRDAQYVFYSGNRFIVRERNSFPRHVRWRERTYRGFAPAIFLRKIVPVECLRHLRHLEIVLPLYDRRRDWRKMSLVYMPYWLETLDWASDKLNLNGLRLRLAAPEDWEPVVRSQAKNRTIMGRFSTMAFIFATSGYGEELRAFYAQPPPLLDHLWFIDSKFAAEVSQERAADIKELLEDTVLGSEVRRERQVRGRIREPEPSVWTDYATRWM